MISFQREHLHLLWSLVETHSQVIQGLNDDAICFWLLKKIKDTIHLSRDDAFEIKHYILSRRHLIRDVACSQNISIQHPYMGGTELSYDEAV
ncbi:MAG: hypothetical protein AAF282_04110 [Cyanobacteria bacterium P01_A01_bin.15]